MQLFIYVYQLKLIPPTGFTGVRYAAGVVSGQGAWFFGGYESVSTGDYAFPQQPFKWANTTWNAAMK